MAESLHTQRSAIVQAVLPNVIFDGWSDKALQAAARECGVDINLLPVLFPRGSVDAIAFHSRLRDNEVVETLSQQEGFAQLPVPVKIKQAIMKRLELSMVEKDAIRKGLSQLSMPQNSKLALTLLHETCDSIWRLADDNATDFNWYSKRLTLSGVYSATLLYWLNDESGELAETERFLSRRLNNVKEFGQLKAKLLKPFQAFSIPKFFA